MNLEELLGGRRKSITANTKETLTPKESVLKEIDNQIRLNKGGSDVPTTSMKVDGKIVKDENGKTKLVPIKSWFNSRTNQFKPTPLGITFFKGDTNAFDVGDSDKGEVLKVFKNCIEDGTYQEDLEHWDKRCQKRVADLMKTRAKK